MTGKVLRFGARHHGTNGRLLNREWTRAPRPVDDLDNLVRLMAGRRQHFGDSFFSWKNDRIVVRPVVILEEALQVLLGIRFQQSRLGE